ncbi:MAG: hypothetical protein ACRDMV_06860 [Streptosporangiales bacterium]
MTPYIAYLRVYEPLVAFHEPARAAWALYSDPDTQLPDPRDVLDMERRTVREQVAASPPVLIPSRESDQALVRRIDGTTYLSPLDTRLRSVLAYNSLEANLPQLVLRSAVPRSARITADAEVARWRSQGAAEYPHVRQSRWHVPLPWFVLFEPAERRLVLVPNGERAAAEGGDAVVGDTEESASEGRPAPDRTLSYLTRMAEARRRLARTLAVLKKTVEGLVVDEVELLGRWLEEFHPHAFVELDYGGIVDLVDDAFLLTDRSVADVAEGVAALADGDGQLAAQRYQAVMQRWSAVERLESAN